MISLQLFKAIVLAGFATLALVSCSSSPSTVPYTGMEAPFIPDAKPIRNANSTDLLTLAETLPIFNSGDSKAWVRNSNPEDGEWLTRVGDPNTPVRIKRLPRGPSGAQRIMVMVGPSKNSSENPPPTWVYDLERVSGGWKQVF
ncbi:hypothetical protein ACFQY0_14610 [Haloferula chungangensis]|uniref:Lipoprotein n=1 Tax=Haloferula chungangensis TaxID=1048331 RepID=A0ABW2L9N8_9BACT